MGHPTLLIKLEQEVDMRHFASAKLSCVPSFSLTLGTPWPEREMRLRLGPSLALAMVTVSEN